ncbi:MAG: thioredoxin family protein [Nanoarchaeota archaeon]|nr:thioredoxin family protein [Nanoarchaeota archaeon]
MLQQELVPELTNGEFEKFIHGNFVVVSFFKDWCMNCLVMDPIVEEISEKFYGKIKFAKINVEDNKEAAKKFGVNSTPCFAIFKDGSFYGKFSGTSCTEEFEDKIKEFLI